MSGDAFHVTMPDGDLRRDATVMNRAIKDAGIRPDQIGYVNAHGTSTPYNDKFESMAIRKVFGEHADKLAVSSTKSMTGHALGAAGGIEAVFSVLAMHENKLPPTTITNSPIRIAIWTTFRMWLVKLRSITCCRTASALAGQMPA